MPNLLVIDDEPAVRSFITSAMSKRGWTVRSASSAAAGMLIARNTHPDVVLCDVVMPRAGAAEFIREFRQDLGHIPVLLMSGYPSGRLRLDGAVRHWWKPVPLLEKPFTIAALEGALQYAVSTQS